MHLSAHLSPLTLYLKLLKLSQTVNFLLWWTTKIARTKVILSSLAANVQRRRWLGWSSTRGLSAFCSLSLFLFSNLLPRCRADSVGISAARSPARGLKNSRFPWCFPIIKSAIGLPTPLLLTINMVHSPFFTTSPATNFFFYCKLTLLHRHDNWHIRIRSLSDRARTCIPWFHPQRFYTSWTHGTASLLQRRCSRSQGSHRGWCWSLPNDKPTSSWRSLWTCQWRFDGHYGTSRWLSCIRWSLGSEDDQHRDARRLQEKSLVAWAAGAKWGVVICGHSFSPYRIGGSPLSFNSPITRQSPRDFVLCKSQNLQEHWLELYI